MCLNFRKYMKSLTTGQRRRFPLTNPLNWLRAAPNKKAILEAALGEILTRPVHKAPHHLLGNTPEEVEESPESPMPHAERAVPRIADPGEYSRSQINAVWHVILGHLFPETGFAIADCWHGYDPAEEDPHRDLMVSLATETCTDMVVFTLQPVINDWAEATDHLLWSLNDVWDAACNPRGEQDNLYGIVVIGLECELFSCNRNQRNVVNYLSSRPLHVQDDRRQLSMTLHFIARKIAADNE